MVTVTWQPWCHWRFWLHAAPLVFGLQEQQEQFPLQKVLKVAATEREFGNYLFRQNRFCDAKVRYKRVRTLWKCVFQTAAYRLVLMCMAVRPACMPAHWACQ